MTGEAGYEAAKGDVNRPDRHLFNRHSDGTGNKERFDGEIFDLDVAMDRVEGAALEFYEAAARRSVRQVFLEVAEKLSEKVESYLQHQYSFKIENPANKHERPHHKYL